jgi:hypothetical protein
MHEAKYIHANTLKGAPLRDWLVTYSVWSNSCCHFHFHNEDLREYQTSEYLHDFIVHLAQETQCKRNGHDHRTEPSRFLILYAEVQKDTYLLR